MSAERLCARSPSSTERRGSPLFHRADHPSIPHTSRRCASLRPWRGDQSCPWRAWPMSLEIANALRPPAVGGLEVVDTIATNSNRRDRRAGARALESENAHACGDRIEGGAWRASSAVAIRGLRWTNDRVKAFRTMPRHASGSSVAPASGEAMVSEPLRSSRREGEKRTRNGAGLAVDQRRRARDALARRALNVVVVVLISKCGCGVRCESACRRARRSIGCSSPGRSRQYVRRLGDDFSVVLFCVDELRIHVMHRVALGLKRCGCGERRRPGMRIIAMLPVAQRSARGRAAAPAQNAIAAKTKRR